MSRARITIPLGTRFGMLVIVEETPSAEWGGRALEYTCACDCGVVKSIAANNIRKGRSRCCGGVSFSRFRIESAVGRLFCHLLPRPVCHHGVTMRAKRWNIYYPCGKGCGTSEPERVYHRWLWRLSFGRLDPFGRSACNQRPW